VKSSYKTNLNGLVYRVPRASRPNGPAPNCEISKAPPSIEMFFMNKAICICAIMGSGTFQNLCIVNVTGTRKSTISQAPIFV